MANGKTKKSNGDMIPIHVTAHAQQAVLPEVAIDPGAFQGLEKSPEDIAGLLGAAMEDMDGRRMPTVTIPTGGSTQWIVDGLMGEEEVETLDGIVVYSHTQRILWDGNFGDGPGGPPLCQSEDGKTGVGEPGGSCSTCSLKRFGEDGEKPRCTAKKRLFLLRPQSVMPLVVTLSVTSMANFEDYHLKAAGIGLNLFQIWTQIGLERTKNQGGIQYSKATFKAAGVLPPQHLKAGRAYYETLRGRDLPAGAAAVDDFADERSFSESE